MRSRLRCHPLEQARGRPPHGALARRSPRHREILRNKRAPCLSSSEASRGSWALPHKLVKTMELPGTFTDCATTTSPPPRWEHRPRGLFEEEDREIRPQGRSDSDPAPRCPPRHAKDPLGHVVPHRAGLRRRPTVLSPRRERAHRPPPALSRLSPQQGGGSAPFFACLPPPTSRMHAPHPTDTIAKDPF